MNKQKKCPACSALVRADVAVCPVCGMDGLNYIFLDGEERNRWLGEKLSQFSRDPHQSLVEQKEDEEDDYLYRDWTPRSIYNPKTGQYDFEIRPDRRKDWHPKIVFKNNRWEYEFDPGWEERMHYFSEHQKFLHTQKEICEKAGIALESFGGKVPFAEKLKVAMTESAEEAYKQEDFDRFVALKLAGARICRVQGQESNAYWLEETAYQYRDKANQMMQKKGVSSGEVEKQCMYSIAQKYKENLYQ